MNTLSDRLLAAIAHAGISKAELARRVGISAPSVNGWFSGKAKFLRGENLLAAASALGVDQGWLATGKGAMLRGDSGGNSLGIRVAPVSASATRPDYVRVEQLDAEAAMGVVGRANDDFPEVVRAMDFAPAYIRSVVGFVPPPGRLKLVTGVGDSMAPKIRPGESVLVDTGCNEFVGDGLYLINTGYGQQIKALQAAPDGLWARSSDQILYPPFRLTEDTIIGGRVYLIQHLERVA